MVDMPETLHHYTTATGLMGIFAPRRFEGWEIPETRSLTLWATDARYLNDAKELTFAAEILATAMSELVDHAEAAHATRIHELANRVRKGDFVDPNVDNSPHTAYVTSFCEEPDLLSQWRGYGGNGYSIEFPAEILKSFKVPTMGVGFLDGSQLFKVRYKIDHSFIETAAKEIVNPSNYAGAVRRIVECLAQFKHPAFEAETEWRLIYSAGHDYTKSDFRISADGMLIPYLQLRCTPYTNLYDPTDDFLYSGKLVESVWVGPSPDQKLRAESLARMLRQWSFSDVRVETSETPFRG
ncbi:DUF2971 domain-containing protein [Rhodococcus sp. SJ-3]|uniref:DUF2971 domain-containing protein n=1 Tax=Rhodococcus sp. SJ-3 TaxID=3454628 RepID=UPI003F793DEA